MLYADFAGNYRLKYLAENNENKDAKSQLKINEKISSTRFIDDVNSYESDTDAENFQLNNLKKRRRRIRRRRLISKSSVEKDNKPAIVRTGKCFGGLISDIKFALNFF